jgi:hypothetical protein
MTDQRENAVHSSMFSQGLGKMSYLDGVEHNSFSAFGVA